MKVFEVSWEVCNKVGGIYTVITSKANYARKNIPHYFFIGPYLSNSVTDFEEKEIPKEYFEISEELKKEGVKIHFGKWMKTRGDTFLIESTELLGRKNEIKTELWNNFKVDSLYAKYDFDEPVVWAYAAGMFLEKVCKKNKNSPEKIVGQFHEWLTGAAILYLKARKAEIATIFTTHATVLERSVAYGGGNIWYGIDGDQEARNRGVMDKHSLEKQSALNAEIFTTVSDSVAKSCDMIFGRKAEIVTINGMDTRSMPNLEEVPQIHKINKEKIKDFVMSYFFPYQHFNIDNTLLYFISGRYEIHAKGIDVMIKAAGNLNRVMKEKQIDKNIVLFILVPAAHEEENLKVVENLVFLKNLKSQIGDYTRNLENKILEKYIANSGENLFDENFENNLKRLIKLFKKNGTPPICTHTLKDGNDEIVKRLLENGLDNREENKIKVIFYPTYLDENDGLLDMDYYSALSGFHLGIFPSFYEPWGYTPVESAALGVPSITTDATGFGQYVLKNLAKEKDEEGIIVIERERKSDEDVVKELTDKMLWYTTLPKISRIKNKIVAENFSLRVSWEFLIDNYLNAYNLAIEKRFGK